MAGLCEEVSYLPVKIHIFVLCQMSTNIFLNPKLIVDFDVAKKQISMSSKLTYVLENITKPVSYVLPPGGRTV